MNLYEDGELERITKIREYNDRMEEFLNNAREKWNKEIDDLTDIAKLQYNAENAQKIVDLQATAIAYRQNINEQISFYLQKRIKEKNKLKSAIHEKTVWYALGKSPLGLSKLSTGQQSAIIDSHVGEVERSVELFEVHIEFLRSCVKNLSDIGYQVKNTIELYNLLSRTN